MHIIYVTFKNGRLIDDEGYDVNVNLPDFKSVEDALEWAAENRCVVR